MCVGVCGFASARARVCGCVWSIFVFCRETMEVRMSLKTRRLSSCSERMRDRKNHSLGKFGRPTHEAWDAAVQDSRSVCVYTRWIGGRSS